MNLHTLRLFAILVSLTVVLGARAPAQLQVVQPTSSFYFDPLGVQTETARVDVYVDQSIFFGRAARPWVVVHNGGGWAPGSGAAGALKRTDLSLAYRLYRRGFAVLLSGYTVLDTSIAGDGLFQPANWRRLPNSSSLVMDPSHLGERSAELDVVNLIQQVRTSGIAGVPDLDRSGGGVLGRSTGSVNMSFVLFGPDRADPTAIDPRFHASTRPAWGVVQNYVGSFRALVPTTKTFHLPDATGARAFDLGAVPDHVIDQASALWFGFAEASVRSANSAVPVFVSAPGQPSYPGPYDYASMAHVLPDVHSPEQVLAIEEALHAAAREFMDDTHFVKSRFVIDSDVLFPGALLIEEQYRFVIAVEGLSYLP